MGGGMGGMPGGMGGHHMQHQGPVKDRAITRHLACTLEELYAGSTRKLKITRSIFSAGGGAPRTEEEILEVAVKPGWKKGTKVTFQEKGTLRRGCVCVCVVRALREGGWVGGRLVSCVCSLQLLRLWPPGASVPCAAARAARGTSRRCQRLPCSRVRRPAPPHTPQATSARGAWRQTWCLSSTRSRTRASSELARGGTVVQVW
jgi:hypothetical protein